ncbi:MAG: hypothetical protein KatS3mg056_2547 [Chloroflexus sp.]|nr:MAG: hypothetical protein KatS3mg056_2547 [Chloroflexus sp.]
MNPGTDVPPVRCQALRRVRGVIDPTAEAGRSSRRSSRRVSAPKGA